MFSLQLNTVLAKSISVRKGESLIEQYCADCHNYEDFSGGLSLEDLKIRDIYLDLETGEKVIERLRAGMMPPAGKPRPDHQTLQDMAALFEKNIDSRSEIKSGRVGLHRLNRTEYGNAIRDLFDLHIDPKAFLPADDSSRGFDNQAGSLGLSPALLEAYLSAAAKISEAAVGTATSPTQVLYRVAEDENQNYRISGLPFGTRGGLKINHNFPADGDYSFKVFPVSLGNMGSHRPFGTVNNETLLLLIDGEVVAEFDWDEEFGIANGYQGTGDLTKLKTLDATVKLSAGEHQVGVTFVATNFAPGLDLNNDFERSTIETGGIPGYTFYPHVGSVRVDGPVSGQIAKSSKSRDKIFSCRPSEEITAEQCAKQIFSLLLTHAYRGYETSEDLQTLLEFYQVGVEEEGFDFGVQLAIQRILSSPKFIYRTELEPEAAKLKDSFPISELELASRLSFFLWSSLPDEELLNLARSKQLRKPKILSQQVTRMLKDSRAEAMTRNFSGQWLALRSLESHAPVVDQFPDFDNLLRDSFRIETELLFDYLVRNNRPVKELLTADYTFLNERLALHYGIPNVRGERFRKVELQGQHLVRRGILGKGSTLTVASQPGRTSPVIRGYWALSNIIGVEPPPPPPDVPALESGSGDVAGNSRVPSMREQMEIHRSNPACEGCHKLMDPIGFALESFDAIGSFRSVENGEPINTVVQMYDGSAADGSTDLIEFMLNYEQSYLKNVTQRMLTYALGRGMEYEDMPMVRAVQTNAANKGFGFQDLVQAVVSSRAFLFSETEVSETDENHSETAFEKIALLPEGAEL